MNWGVEFHLEPLLAAIVGSFMVNNYSRHRLEFVKIIQEVGPTVYVVFFTLTGASLSIDLLLQAWSVAIVLFAVRLVALFLGGMVGGYFGGDPVRHNLIAWMPYVTQAGVGLGLAMLVAQEYPAWGGQFATVIIAVIVLNQVAGPPLF